MRKLERDFFGRPTLEVARAMLGQALVHETPAGRLAGIVVECEAYVGTEDLASHARRGRTARTSRMFGPPGIAYVYLIYGMYTMLNVVTEEEDFPAAVLVRALEPLERITGGTNGPGRLCRALGIDRGYDGLDLCGDVLYFADVGRAIPDDQVRQTPRIGVDYAGEWAARPWRFLVAGNRWVSVPPPVATTLTGDGDGRA
ncbi:MAG: DNA-3-methyladenine glycosylase [Chloroflexi bacterium]|nr:DNA-3-methyladenine glycosylase [Chloroflexota bacterium]